MATEPKVTPYGPFDDSAWVNIPATMFAVKVMEIEEVPPASGIAQGTFNPQGLQYQLWDYSLNGGIGGWNPNVLQALPGLIIVGDGFTVIGNNGQPTNWAGTRAADNPIRIKSGTSTNTQVQVREFCRKIATATI